MNNRHVLVAAGLIAGSIAGSATADAASASGCTSYGSGNTATGYCTVVPAGAWYYEEIHCRDKAGHFIVLNSPRSYIPWIAESVSCGSPYVRTGQQIRHS